jgi:hypothetical protein
MIVAILKGTKYKKTKDSNLAFEFSRIDLSTKYSLIPNNAREKIEINFYLRYWCY